MSFVKADVKPVDSGDSELQQTMCQAHGCPHRWMINDAKGRLCRWHHYAEPHDWPSITSQIRLGMAPKEPQKAVSQQVDTEGVRKVAQAFRSIGAGGATKSWAYRLKEREEAGERLSVAQRKAWRDALRFQDEQE